MGNLLNTTEVITRVIASENNWIEGNSIQQLEATAKLKGIKMAVGLPDLHAGKGYPVGAAFLSKGWIYPALVGNDIGCGMGLWQTELKTSKIKRDKWSSALQLDGPWDGDTGRWLESYGLPSILFDRSIGTIGGGNHFAELQQVEEIYDLDAVNALGIDEKRLHLLVHSGSRGLGEVALRKHVDAFGHCGLEDESSDANLYIGRHDQAVKWARANRSLIAHRFLSSLRSDGSKVLDLDHNTVTPREIDGERYWLHRKGASPSDSGALVIPGSRGTFSYLVQPLGEQLNNAYSLAHGAGRKWVRSDVKGRLSHKYKVDDLRKTNLGSVVICENKALIYEEAPQAYKNIDIVIQDMVDAELIKVLATLRPVITYKTRRKK
ncbi:MAG: RNA ligase RtcB family protein [Arenicella sp.]|nr:RNA ligase RtcB family protein [Arenicella sp.]